MTALSRVTLASAGLSCYRELTDTYEPHTANSLAHYAQYTPQMPTQLSRRVESRRQCVLGYLYIIKGATYPYGGVGGVPISLP